MGDSPSETVVEAWKPASNKPAKTLTFLISASAFPEQFCQCWDLAKLFRTAMWSNGYHAARKAARDYTIRLLVARTFLRPPASLHMQVNPWKQLGRELGVCHTIAEREALFGTEERRRE